jgi:hypothetical protein
MQADFSRITFDPAKHFSAVLLQQGRVQLDADANEQAAILLRQLRIAVADILGPAAAPAGAPGFEIGLVDGKSAADDLAISPGRMYVDGILVENDAASTYWTQPDAFLDPDDPADALPGTGTTSLVYLRVWERLITAVQDPSIREIALGDTGPDTAARARTVWQVAVTTDPAALDSFPGWLTGLRGTGRLAAEAVRPDTADDPCHLSPRSRFRGVENQLYRVEVHSGGPAAAADPGPLTRRPRASGQRGQTAAAAGPTFKWSRENASVVLPILSVSGNVVRLATLGRDDKLELEIGDRVEILDDAIASRLARDAVLAGGVITAPRLREVVEIDDADRLITLDGDPEEDCAVGPHPFLRRWDHGVTATSTPAALAADGAVPIVEGQWLDLEDGVRVRFDADGQPGAGPGTYRPGDYWMIPARVATGDVLWPRDQDGPVAEPPRGVAYHYAALATITNGEPDSTPRRVFEPLLDTAAQVADQVAGPARGSARESARGTGSAAARPAKVPARSARGSRRARTEPSRPAETGSDMARSDLPPSS